MNDDWTQDTTDVLHCSMPPQVRAHIEELRDEVARLRAAEVPLSANRGFLCLKEFGDISANGYDHDEVWPSVDAVRADRPSAEPQHIVALIPVTAWDRT